MTVAFYKMLAPVLEKAVAFAAKQFEKSIDDVY